MRMRAIDIFEFPTNLGLRQLDPDHEPGVNRMPEWLHQHGLHERLQAEHVFRLEPPAYGMEQDEPSGILNVEAASDYAIRQAQLMSRQLERDSFKLILGGDCSILIGSTLALKQRDKYGLFFLDGHTDYITPDLSQTGGIAGMDLAIAAGVGDERLTNLEQCKPYVEPQHIFCVGNREYDQAYVKPVLKSDVHYYDLARVRSEGIQPMIESFLAMMNEQELDGFLIHLDVDVLNDTLMPAVDSRQPDGLSYDELAEILISLVSHRLAVGMEVSILDPSLDPDGQYTAALVNHLTDVLDHM
ncbi:arginase family protein [Paenibacillus wulumuqiensis]|uniref:arginase family protein n=1 Tax=Paenibacillus wulumuqiensis TaxID=1567107 RepID=UPI000AF87D9D|nr:arginase family protein [Paenibacillus wulumuqiensis]